MSHQSINLLPTALRRRLTIRRGLRQWVVGWGVVGLFALGCWGVVWSETRQLRADVNETERSCGNVCRMQTVGRGYDQRIDVLNAKKSALQSAADNSAGLKTLGVVSASVKSVDSTVIIDEIIYRETAAEAGAKDAGALRSIGLDIAGLAENDQTVGRFVSQLRKTRVFDSVDLKSTRGAGGTGAAANRRFFRLDCKLYVDPALEAKRQ